MTETAVDNDGTREAAGLPRLSLSMAWWALSTAAFFIVVAPLLAVGVGAGNVLAGMAISVCVFAWLGGQLSRFAMRSGSSVATLSRDMFGLGGGDRRRPPDPRTGFSLRFPHCRDLQRRSRAGSDSALVGSRERAVAPSVCRGPVVGCSSRLPAICPQAPGLELPLGA